jgi:hypothetical protein
MKYQNRLWILLVIGILGCSATQNASENPTCKDHKCEVWIHTSKGPGARISYGKTDEGIQKITIVELMDGRFSTIPENLKPEND